MAKIFINIPDIHNPDNKIKFSIEYSDDYDDNEEDIKKSDSTKQTKPNFSNPFESFESFESFVKSDYQKANQSNPPKRKLSKYNIFVKYHLILMKELNITQQQKIKRIGELWQLKKEMDKL